MADHDQLRDHDHEAGRPPDRGIEDRDQEPSAGRSGVARPLLGLACLVPLAAAVALVSLTPPSETVSVTRGEASSRPGSVQMWCPGPVQPPDPLLEEGPDEDLSVTPPHPAVDVGTVAFEPESSLLFGAVSGAETLQEDDGSIRAPQITAEGSDGSALPGESAAQDLGVSVRTDAQVQDAPLLSAASSQDLRPVADAVQSTATGSGDYRSLAVSRCARPTTEASFLGISTTTGNSSALVLRNPSSQPATASVQLWTEEGPAAMAGRSQVVVGPGEEERILLESVAGGHEALGVEVSVLGAPLAMHVQSTERDGLTPGGAEILTPQSPASAQQVMPAVDVAGVAPTLVLANPHGASTSARVVVSGPDGPVEAATREDVEIPGGAVTTLTLDGVPDGNYSVIVEAEGEVLATTRTSTTGTELPGDTLGAPVDFTLAAAAAPIEASAVTALPATGAHGYLVLAALADTAVTIIPIGADGAAGEPVEVDVSAGTSTPVLGSELALGDASPAALAIVPEEPGAVHASWMQRQDDDAGDILLSALPVPAGAATADAVTVRLGE